MLETITELARPSDNRMSGCAELDPEAFQAWLELQPAGSAVGTIADACDCPLARYGRALGFEGYLVDMRIPPLPGHQEPYTVYSEHGPALPPALRWFAILVDLLRPQSPVLREEALDLLATARSRARPDTKVVASVTVS